MLKLLQHEIQFQIRKVLVLRFFQRQILFGNEKNIKKWNKKILWNDPNSFCILLTTIKYKAYINCLAFKVKQENQHLKKNKYTIKYYLYF